MAYIAPRACDYSFPFALTNSDGSSRDLTGCTLFMTIKLSPSSDSPTDDDAIYQQTIVPGEIPTPAAGLYTFVITAAEMRTFEIGQYYVGFALLSATGVKEAGPEDTFEVVNCTTLRTS